MRTEEIIRQRLTSLEEGMEEAMHSYLTENCPMYIIFYDKKNKGCIGVDVFGLSDPSYKKEKQRLTEYVEKRPNRFVKLPGNTAKLEFGIMSDFADKKQIAELSNALISDKPMRMFKKKVTELDLEIEWFEFRDSAYEKFIKAWL